MKLTKLTRKQAAAIWLESTKTIIEVYKALVCDEAFQFSSLEGWYVKTSP